MTKPASMAAQQTARTVNGPGGFVYATCRLSSPSSITAQEAVASRHPLFQHQKAVFGAVETFRPCD